MHAAVLAQSPKPVQIVAVQSAVVDLTGLILSERYQITGTLGDGAMATVYSAVDLTNRDEIAIKILKEEVRERSSYYERFEREHLICSKLSDPLCIRMLSFGTTEKGLPFQVMELVRGGSLSDLLDSEERLDTSRALTIFANILRALSVCADAGVIHRDIKPENVLIYRDANGVECVKLIDFGIAKLIGQAAVGHDRLTSIGIILGTPHYIAPEWVTSDHVDCRADLYSASILLFEMLTSAPPFLDEDRRELMKMHLRQLPPSLTERVPGGVFSPGLEALVKKGLAKNPDERFSSSREYLDALSSLIQPAVPTIQLPGLQSEPVVVQAPITPRAETSHIPERASSAGWRPSKMAIVITGIALAALVVSAVLFGDSPSETPSISPSQMDAGAVADVVIEQVDSGPIAPPAEVISDAQIALVSGIWTDAGLDVSGFGAAMDDELANGACRSGMVGSLHVLLCSAGLDPIRTAKKIRRDIGGGKTVKWRQRITRLALHLRVESVSGKKAKRRRRKIENLFRSLSAKE